jgi:NAD-dependent SIR2 family protein deacetylase
MTMPTELQRAKEAIHRAKAILICAGAGMGVDSGLPDFRGNEGFWRAYPPYQKLGLRFEELANPQWFRQDPALGWGFYGHRLNLYRQTKPHAGFDILRRWCTEEGRTHFVFTSNVDGHFQRSGFGDDSIYEVHGSIHHLQCVDSCGVGILSADPFEVIVDHDTMQAKKPMPLCPKCGCLMRPNILMFGDWYWDSERSDQQQARFGQWLRSIEGPLVVIECGAGTAIPTVRQQSEMLVARLDATLIRINPRDYRVPKGQFAIAANTLEALEALEC